MSLLKKKTPQIREKRLNAVSAYYDNAGPLLEELEEGEARQRIRTFSQDAFNDILYALRLINGIEDAAVVIHGPKGCGASQVYFDSKSGSPGKWAITDINEKDSIIGSEAKLKEALLALYRTYRPAVIFIVMTPVVAINNDDVQAVVEELGEELEVKLIPIFTDGFKSRVGAMGYDLVYHALAKYLIGREGGEGGGFINLLSVEEAPEDLKELERLVGKLGVNVNILPQKATAGNFLNAGNASLSVSINLDDSDYLGEVLEEKYGIGFIKPALPVGLKGTARWLGAVGENIAGPEKIEELTAREEEGLDISQKGIEVEGLKVYLNLPPSYAFGVKEFLEELGAEVVGITVPYIQQNHMAHLQTLLRQDRELNLHIAEGQSFEELNILKKLQPDLYIGWEANSAVAAAGIPSTAVGGLGILGYSGAERLLQRISRAIKNRAYFNRISKAAGQNYTQGWYSRKPNWYIKQEVK